jgi:hypothetical protein
MNKGQTSVAGAVGLPTWGFTKPKEKEEKRYGGGGDDNSQGQRDGYYVRN